MKSSESTPYVETSLRRRQTLGLLGGGLIFGIPGCCSLRPFPKPEIPVSRSAAVEVALLAPRALRRDAAQRVYCVDAHAHFFNASDVTVHGYLAGPIAHSIGGAQGELLRLLAPLADAIAGLAPTAKEEYDELDRLTLRVIALSEDKWDDALASAISAHRELQSVKFFDLLKTREGQLFAQTYERIQQDRRAQGFRAQALRVQRIDASALKRAMELGEQPVGDAAEIQRRPIDETFYADGILAFVGYMLSYRWANLQSYKTVSSSGGQGLNVNRVLGALVDFDRWLDCAPRSAHDDQMRLHARLSKLSNGYMKPLIGYNPWTDVVDDGASRKRVEDAVKNWGFVGAKIYPPNGFRPWGNTAAQDAPKRPPHDKINAALKAFWEMCNGLKIPVMAHTGQSMGKDDGHDDLGGPEGWKALVEAQAKNNRSPTVNLGHFGGDDDKNNWTSHMAQIMGQPYADKVYGDLGYWSNLQCNAGDASQCSGAQRLKQVLNMPVGNQERVADRVMYGSDWLMLSRAPYWSRYATDLYATLKQIAPTDVDRIFGENVLKCFAPQLDRT